MADVSVKLRVILHRIAKENLIENYQLFVEPISTGGGNYSSHLYLANYKYNDSDEVVKVFVKVAATGKEMREQTPLKMYETERHFYTCLMKVYKEIEDRNELEDEDKFKFPKFYGHCDTLYEETIVLDDLGTKGYVTYDRMKSVDWAFAAAAITELTKFHALSIAYQIQEPMAFEQDIEKLKLDWGEGDEVMVYWDNMAKGALEAVADEYKDILKRYFDSGVLTKETFQKMSMPKKLLVLIHGDFRPSNMMYKIRENGTVDLVTVDFQTIQSGSPVIDFMYFLITGTDEEFRKNHYDALVTHYYTQLTEAMNRLAIDPSAYSEKDFKDELKEKMHFGLAIAISLLPIVTVEAENAPKVDLNLDLKNFSIKTTSSLYSDRLNGVIRDLIKWGVLE